MKYFVIKKKDQIMKHENAVDQEIGQKWVKMLSIMLADFRENFPDDVRTDTEFLENLMDYFHETGLIKRAGDGKYMLPNIEGIIEIEKNYLQ
jgi:hypothetical protein